jgi:hypothetical protein
MAKKMGTNPLSGLNSLIRDTQEDNAAHETHDVQGVDVTHDQHNAHKDNVAHDQHITQDAPDEHKVLIAQDEHSAHKVRLVQDAMQVQDVPNASQEQDAQQVQYQYDAQVARHEYDLNHGEARALVTDIVTNQDLRTQGRKGQKLPRINMAFAPDNLAYLQAIAGFERMSATQYVNNLIREDQKKRQPLYEQLLALRGN